MTTITVIGGGFAGLVASIASAEAGAKVVLYEVHQRLGGRARATDGPYIAHDGPHVLYCDGPWWAWLRERNLLGAFSGVPLAGATGFVFRRNGRLRRVPPFGLVRLLAHRSLQAPVDQDFHSWVAGMYGDETAVAAANLLGVATFDANPGRLSAAFVWERIRRVFAPRPPARYLTGGWNGLIERITAHARAFGVVIETGTRVEEIPSTPVIVATTLDSARRLLGDSSLSDVESGRAVLLDLAVRKRRGDAFVVSDLDAAGWFERYTVPDPTVAPAGESLVQSQIPLFTGESKQDGLHRLEAMIDLALPGWRERVTWRRDAIANGRSGALDLPGRTWRDRPAIERGDGVFLAGDQVAAPGLLSEVSFHSGIAAAGAVNLFRRGRVDRR